MVGDTNGADLALGQLGHGYRRRKGSVDESAPVPNGSLTLPGVDDGNTVIEDHITTLHRAVGDEREVRLALLESDGPVNKVELSPLASFESDRNITGTYVKVVELELSKAGVQRGLDNLGAVLAACS